MSRSNHRAKRATRRGSINILVEHLEPRRLISGTAQFTDTDGDVVTATVTGKGTVQIFQSTRNVWVSGSNVNTALTITVQRSPTGDGLATMGELRCFGPMLSVNAPNINFTHEVTTDDDNIAVAPSAKISMNLGQLINLGMWTGGQRIGSLTVADWSVGATGGTITAPSIDSFTVTGRPATGASPALPGNNSEDMYIGDNTTSPADYSIGWMQVAGTVGSIQATGQIGAIIAGAIDGQISATTVGRIRAKVGTGTDGSIQGSVATSGLPGLAMSMGIIRARSANNETITSSQGGIGFVRFTTDATGLLVQSVGDIQTLIVGGGLASSRIQTAGSAGTIVAAAIGDSGVEVGVSNSFTGTATSRASFSNPVATLGSFTITGKNQPADEPMITGTNSISAPNIGTLALLNPDSSAALQIYVLGSANPMTVDMTIQANPSGDFVWHPGQPVPQLLAGMLHVL